MRKDTKQFTKVMRRYAKSMEVTPGNGVFAESKPYSRVEVVLHELAHGVVFDYDLDDPELTKRVYAHHMRMFWTQSDVFEVETCAVELLTAMVFDIPVMLEQLARQAAFGCKTIELSKPQNFEQALYFQLQEPKTQERAAKLVGHLREKMENVSHGLG